MEKIIFKIGEVTTEMDKDAVSKAMETGIIELKSDNLIEKTEGVVVYSKDEFEKFKTNISNVEYKKGKEAGLEMAIKDAREKYDLEFEGKTIDNLIDAVSKKVLEDAKVKPAKEIEILKSDNAKLKENYKQLEEDHNNYIKSVTEEKVRNKKNDMLLSLIPESGVKVNKKITLLALKDLGVDVDFDENSNPFLTYNGDIIKDQKTLEPIKDHASYISAQLESLNLIDKPNGGHAKGDQIKDYKESSYDAFVKEMKDNNITEGSEKFSIELNKRIGDKTLKV